MSVAAVILAAGGSRRLGEPKQLLVYRGETLLNRALRLVQEAGALPVIVLLGARFETISASIKPAGAMIVYNERWGQGIASSIHKGIDAVRISAPQASGVLFIGCDQPRLTAQHLRALLDTFHASGSTSVVCSAYDGAFGVPAVFPCETYPDLLALSGDRGARALLANPPCQVVKIPFDGGEVDIDMPEDLPYLT